MVFISPKAVESRNVRNEINFALNHKKPFLAVHVRETNLPPGLLLRMGDIQAVLKYATSEERYRRLVEKTLTTNLGAHPRMDSAAAAQVDQDEDDEHGPDFGVL